MKTNVNENKIEFNNPIKLELFDAQGNLKWSDEICNGIVDEGIEYILEVAFNGGAQDTSHYIGLIDNASYTTGLAAADTHASHSGWIENTDYDEATRELWNPDTTASRAVTNSTPVEFTMNASVTIKGIFVSSVSTKGSVSGAAGDYIWATALFSSDAVVVSTDVLKVTYTVSG